MDYLELSKKNVQEKSKELFTKIKDDDYNFELVIFIARGALYIGQEISKLNNVPLLEIKATRKTSFLKSIIKPIMKLIPKNILIYMRKKEMNSNYHEKNSERKVDFNHKQFQKYKKVKKIIIVDDSIDSGNTILEVKKVLEDFFDEAEFKIAALNYMKKTIIKPEYYIFSDTMLNGPWSNDSKYNKEFIKKYEEWKKEYEKKC